MRRGSAPSQRPGGSCFLLSCCHSRPSRPHTTVGDAASAITSAKTRLRRPPRRGRRRPRAARRRRRAARGTTTGSTTSTTQLPGTTTTTRPATTTTSSMTMTTSSPTSTATTATPTTPLIVGHPLRGKSLLLTDDASRPRGSGSRSSRGTRASTWGRGTRPAASRCAYELPAAHCAYLGKAGAKKGYRYRDVRGADGPIRSVVVKNGKLLRAAGAGRPADAHPRRGSEPGRGPAHAR